MIQNTTLTVSVGDGQLFRVGEYIRISEGDKSPRLLRWLPRRIKQYFGWVVKDTWFTITEIKGDVLTVRQETRL